KMLTREQERFLQVADIEEAFSPHFWRGYFFEQVGQLEQAYHEYEHVLRRLDGLASEPDATITNMEAAVWARVHLGRMLAARGEYERVAELAEQIKLVGRNQPNPKIERLALFLWGASEFYQGNYESAAELLERSIWSYCNGFAIGIRMFGQCLRQ